MRSGDNAGGGDVLGNEPMTWRSDRDRPTDLAMTDCSVPGAARLADHPEPAPEDPEAKSQAMLRESLETLIKLNKIDGSKLPAIVLGNKAHYGLTTHGRVFQSRSLDWR